MPSDRPVFVVGCARSGSTLLQLMLHAHPRIAVPPETRFLIPAYKLREQFGDLRIEANRRQLANFIVGRKRDKFADLGLKPKRIRRKIVQGPPTLGSAVGIVFREYAARWGKPRWGDKRPAYILDLDLLYRLFPDAQVLHIIRDGRDCVASLKDMPWWHAGSVWAIHYWKAAMLAGAKARRQRRADAYAEVHYEALVNDPRAELTRICAFLGEDFDEAMLKPHELADEAVPGRKQHHARTHVAVDTAAIDRWTETLQSWEVALMELVARRQLHAQGYTLTLRRPCPPPAKVASYVLHAGKHRLSGWWRRAQDRVVSARYGRPVAAQLTQRQRELARQP
ncbi:MAG: sulfotransferase family protein [Egibacteraceae bacterium]